MMLPRQTLALAGLCLAALRLVSSCTDSTSPRPIGPFSTGSSSSSGVGGQDNTGGGGADGGTVGTGGTGGVDEPLDLGDLEIVDIVDAPCEQLVGTTVQLYPDGSGAPPFSMLTRLGNKRLAGGRYVPGFATFGIDGSSPSPTVVGLDPDFDLVASEGSTIGLATSDGTSVRFQRYASNDSPIGSPVPLGSSLGSGLAIAGQDAAGSLVVWADDTILRGRFVKADGTAEPTFSFADGVSTKEIVTSLVWDQQDFVLAWSSTDTDIVKTHTRFARLNASGLVGNIVDITGPAENHYVVKVITTSTGYAVLLQVGLNPFDTILILLDKNANVVGPARHFLGTRYGYDIGYNGSKLALLAKRQDASAGFRLLDAAGDPVGRWKCLDNPSGDSYDLAAIDADGTGWAIVYRTPLGGEKFVRTNETGMSGP